MKSKRHLQAIEDSKKMEISIETPKIVSRLLKNIKEARKNQSRIEGNILAKAYGYPVPYPNL